MKNQFTKLVSMAALLAVAVLPTSCSKDEEVSNSTPFAASETTTSKYISIEGEVTGDVLLTAREDKNYLITGPIIVTAGSSLTIDPAGADMTIEAEPNFSAYILVAQGGQMYVRGEATAVVKFTTKESSRNKYTDIYSVEAKNNDRWGGLVINGYAPISGAVTGTTSSTEVSASYKYGGTDEADYSGSYTYMWLDRTGAKSSANVEHNGLTLNGVGSTTVIENVYITLANDDAIEFFGGTVDVENLLVVDADDDMFDFTQGYAGTLTNAYGIWTGSFYSDESDPRGIEADGNLDGLGSSHVGQSNFTVTNMTIDIRNDGSIQAGYKDENEYVGGQMHDAIKIRRGAKATITNALVLAGTTAIIKDLVDLYDKLGAANTGTDINVTYTNSSSHSTNSIKDYSNVTQTSLSGITTGGSNAGATASAFSWIGSDYSTLFQ